MLPACTFYNLQPAIYLYYTLQFRNYIHKLDPRPARACSCDPLLLPARRSSTTWVCNISVASAWANTTSTLHCCTCKPEQTMQCPLGQRDTQTDSAWCVCNRDCHMSNTQSESLKRTALKSFLDSLQLISTLALQPVVSSLAGLVAEV